MLRILSGHWQIAHLSRPAMRHVRTSLIKWSNYFILQHFWKPFRLRLTAYGTRHTADGNGWRRMSAAAITHMCIVWGAHTHTLARIQGDMASVNYAKGRQGSGLRVWLVSGPSLGLSSARTCTYHTSPPHPAPSTGAPRPAFLCVGVCATAANI